MSVVLCEERTLETAEQTLEMWAAQLAEDGRDHDAAEALRLASAILRFRCDFLDGEKG